MTKNSLLATVAVITGLAAGQASALELWEPHLPGADIGMVAGALPPPGFYGVMTNYAAKFHAYDNNGNKTATKLDALVEVPIVLWSSGYKVMGADFGMAAAFPYTYTNFQPAGAGGNSHVDRYNTILVPAILGWHLSPETHVKASLVVSLDNSGTKFSNTPAGTVPSGNSYQTIMPEIGISYMADGWHLSADTYWGLWNTTDSFRDYKSGKSFQADLTATKKFGNWDLGVGGFIVKQFTDDTGTGAVAAGCQALNGCRRTRYALGPVASYQAGKVNISMIYTHDLKTENAVGGDIFNLRLLFPF